jgi:hypothetical protein
VTPGNEPRGRERELQHRVSQVGERLRASSAKVGDTEDEPGRKDERDCLGSLQERPDAG